MRRLLTITVLLLSSSLACDAPKDRGLNPGQYPPELLVTELSSNKAHALEGVKDHVTVINFFASWCPPCIAELPSLERLYQLGKEKKITVIGTAIDDSAQNIQQIVSEAGVTYPVYLDIQGKAKSLFKLGGLPETYVLTRQGKLTFLKDPAQTTPQLKITGDREWDSEEMISALEPLNKL